MWGPTYNDRCYCAAADKCVHADKCGRKLTERDREIVKRDGWLVAYWDKCKRFEEKK